MNKRYKAESCNVTQGWRFGRTPQAAPADTDEIAYISCDGSSTRCKVVNISAEGAALEVPDAEHPPARFNLMTEKDRVVRRCRIVWIHQNKIGVMFEADI